MRANEFTTEEMPTAGYINKTIKKKEWSQVGRGVDGSVWQHINDPDTVVKVVGGGTRVRHWAGIGSVMFANFCVDHAGKNKHLPKVIAINNDDPDVVQIKFERLIPLPIESDDADLGIMLARMAEGVEFNYSADNPYHSNILRRLENALELEGLARYNTIDDLIAAVRLVFKSGDPYARKFKAPHPTLDLHEGNWMMRQDGTIVMSDPWHVG